MVFTRYPEAGKAKTRLIPELGADGAAALAQELAQRAFRVAGIVSEDEGIDVSLWFTGCNEDRARLLAPNGFTYYEQQGADLGGRMKAAFEATFNHGYEEVALVGTDCPELDEAIIVKAFDVLAEADLAIGPATDGGYYLIALRAPRPDLFRGIDWGSASVLEATLDAASNLGLAVEALPALWDVDRPEDLADYELWKTRQASRT